MFCLVAITCGSGKSLRPRKIGSVTVFLAFLAVVSPVATPLLHYIVSPFNRKQVVHPLRAAQKSAFSPYLGLEEGIFVAECLPKPSSCVPFNSKQVAHLPEAA